MVEFEIAILRSDPSGGQCVLQHPMTDVSKPARRATLATPTPKREGRLHQAGPQQLERGRSHVIEPERPGRPQSVHVCTRRNTAPERLRRLNVSSKKIGRPVL